MHHSICELLREIVDLESFLFYYPITEGLKIILTRLANKNVRPPWFLHNWGNILFGDVWEGIQWSRPRLSRPAMAAALKPMRCSMRCNWLFTWGCGGGTCICGGTIGTWGALCPALALGARCALGKTAGTGKIGAYKPAGRTRLHKFTIDLGSYACVKHNHNKSQEQTCS